MILRIWYHLKRLCLKITVSNSEKKYSCYLCQYQNFEIHACRIINDVHDKYNGDFYQYIWGKFNEIFLQRYDTFILFAKTFDLKHVVIVLFAVESPLKYRNILVRNVDVILLSHAISSIGPNISDCDTYCLFRLPHDNTAGASRSRSVKYIIMKCICL